MAQLKYPIGIQTFSTIREGGYVYVDKTDYLHKLLRSGSSYVFLSRPRRFGKSLFISMIEEFFLDHRELFCGLEIERHDYDWAEHPVLRFDLSGSKYDASDSLHILLDDILKRYESTYSIPHEPAKPLGLRFKEIIIKAHQQTGRQVVILIDEYDKPLLDTVDNEPLQEDFRHELRAFYSNLKSQDAHIRFAFLTGVTKFGHLSIFSDLNNLRDISMLPEYSGICGITPDELHYYFDDGVETMAQALDISKEEAYSRLKLNYDGYHFAPKNCVDIYNPFSILNALNDSDIKDYWFRTATLYFLIKLIKCGNIPLENLSEAEATPSLLSSVSLQLDDAIPVLYQTGYLTIKNYDPELDVVTLGFPNREVENGFLKQLMAVYTNSTLGQTEFSILKFIKEVRNGQLEVFMKRLQALFAGFNQDAFNLINLEQHYQDIVFLVMKLMGYYTQVEYKTASGRIDLVVKTPKYIYIFEFKRNKSAREALEQINSKDYAIPFQADGRQIIRIGANFDDATHGISEWIIE